MPLASPSFSQAAAVPCGSASTSVTAWLSARQQARLTATVLLPVPPLRLPTAMILLVKAPTRVIARPSAEGCAVKVKAW